MHGATEANGVKQEKKKAEWGERAIENDKSNPSCLPRREVSGTIADMKSAWTSSRSAECYL